MLRENDSDESDAGGSFPGHEPMRNSSSLK